MKRHATANWQGTGKEGKGYVSTQSPAVTKAFYAYATRFLEEHGTNPEELAAAAHASCFSMKLAFLITGAGFNPENIDTRCDITLNGEKGVITESHLTVKATVPGISKPVFDQLIDDATKNCPISKLFSTNITCSATLL